MSKLQTPLNHSSNDGTKLITFRAPNSIVNDFDQLIKFKRGSRTSYLVGFMDHFNRSEFNRMKESNRINEFINGIRSGNSGTGPLPKSSDNVWKSHEDDYEPPMIPKLTDDDDFELGGWREAL